MKTGGRTAAGFTIVETLIVLAVTGILATSTMLLVSGKQNKTEFQVAANNLKQQLEQIVNETASGYYPKSENFTCDGRGVNRPVLITNTPADQGTNDSCLFLGKAVEFGIGRTAVNDEAYSVYPLIGNRFSITGTEASSYTDALPIALAKGSRPGVDDNNGIDLAADHQTQNGLGLAYARYIPVVGPTSDKSYAVFALIDQLDQYVPVDTEGNLGSATQRLGLYDYDPDAGVWLPAPTASAKVVSGIYDQKTSMRELQAIELCFASGGTDQSALLRLTGNGQLAVTITVHEGVTCS